MSYASGSLDLQTEYSKIELIQAEIGTVERFLAEISQNSILEQDSWRRRLRKLRQELIEIS